MRKTWSTLLQPPLCRSRASPDYCGGGGDNQTVAYVMQDYFTSFAARGIPEGQEDPLAAVSKYGKNATLTVLAIETISIGSDPAAKETCAWWQTALAE